MTCRDCVELLMEFLNEELDAEVCERIRVHLKECPPCVAYVESYQITVELTRRLPRSLPPDVEQRLREALRDCFGDEGSQTT
jgi:anti-sigma factor RsiW